jgi:beta-lactamase regulating signal transducer with metallopeptidase domain
MGIGTSLVLIAVGAILKWAVTDEISGVELSTIGLILLIVGVIGLLISLLFMGNAFGRRDTVVRERYTDDRPPA